MKHQNKWLSLLCIISICIVSCNSSVSEKNAFLDTARRMTGDTTVIPGTPGPSGTEPRPGDTTQAHRDSLKRAVHISDSSRGSDSKK